jgi:hypothetical protein
MNDMIWQDLTWMTWFNTNDTIWPEWLDLARFVMNDMIWKTWRDVNNMILHYWDNNKNDSKMTAEGTVAAPTCFHRKTHKIAVLKSLIFCLRFYLASCCCDVTLPLIDRRMQEVGVAFKLIVHVLKFNVGRPRRKEKASITFMSESFLSIFHSSTILIFSHLSFHRRRFKPRPWQHAAPY